MQKKLAVFTDCIHFYNNEGVATTQVHIFCRQILALSKKFEHTTIYCPFAIYVQGLATSNYLSGNISFYSLPLVGGNKLSDKINILFAIPKWLKAYRHAYKNADIIYQRFPNNLNIPGILFFYLRKAKVFGTYTGTWTNYKGEPLTYRFQKWFLKKFFRGPVGIYSTEVPATHKLFRSFSPSYTDDLWRRESELVEQKLAKIQSNSHYIPVFVTAGALVESKNQQLILDAFRQLAKEGFDFRLFVAGDGMLKATYEIFIQENNLSDKIFLTGHVDTARMKELYRKADFVIQASLIEGYGKVPMEGLFFGAIPILNNVNLAGVITGYGQRGFLFSAKEKNELLSVIKQAVSGKEKLTEFIRNGRTYVREHTIDIWVEHYIKYLNDWFEK